MNKRKSLIKSFGVILGIIIICSLLLVVFFTKNTEKQSFFKLPYYGKKQFNGKDSIFHTIPDFDLINQNGDIINRKNLEGKIYVADYFFTTCQSICPIMKKQMNRVYEKFKNDREVLLVSHTVNPEVDSVLTLKNYSKNLGIDDRKWIFLTGKKDLLYKLAREGYYLDASSGDGGPDDFIHTQNFALIDKSFQIRGYYDGTDSTDVNRLIKEIEILKSEN